MAQPLHSSVDAQQPPFFDPRNCKAGPHALCFMAEWGPPPLPGTGRLPEGSQKHFSFFTERPLDLFHPYKYRALEGAWAIYFSEACVCSRTVGPLSTHTGQGSKVWSLVGPHWHKPHSFAGRCTRQSARGCVATQDFSSVWGERSSQIEGP